MQETIKENRLERKAKYQIEGIVYRAPVSTVEGSGGLRFPLQLKNHLSSLPFKAVSSAKKKGDLSWVLQAVHKSKGHFTQHEVVKLY